MSYGYEHRKKTIKQFKKKFGANWYMKYREYVSELEKKRLGKPVALELFLNKI